MDTCDLSNHTVKQDVNEEEVRSEDEESLFLSPNLGDQRCIDLSSCEAADRSIIYFGQSFPSFSEVSMSVRKYESANRVRLSQKYFRRIAANPKPSNKEDYMLTENERKRFVYRWVDFCCSYFDELMMHGGNHLPAQGSEDTPSYRYTKKECPMRIRFQMRFKEKDITVSIFRESHDHEPPEEEHANLPLLSEGMNYDLVSNEQNRSRYLGPPSLVPIPKTLVKTKKRNSFNPNSVIENTLLPKPPPLKKGPISVSPATQSEFVFDSKTFESEDLGNVKLSAQTIIKNVHSYLHRTSTYGSNMKNGIVFTSPHPNIIKLTADLCNVDEKVVLHLTSVNNPKQKTVASSDKQCNTSKSCYVDVKNNKKRNGTSVTSVISSMPKKTFKESSGSGVLRQHWHTRMHTDEEFENQSCGNLPLEVIIKTEPDGNVV